MTDISKDLAWLLGAFSNNMRGERVNFGYMNGPGTYYQQEPLFDRLKREGIVMEENYTECTEDYTLKKEDFDRLNEKYGLVEGGIPNVIKSSSNEIKKEFLKGFSYNKKYQTSSKKVKGDLISLCKSMGENPKYDRIGDKYQFHF